MVTSLECEVFFMKEKRNLFIIGAILTLALGLGLYYGGNLTFGNTYTFNSFLVNSAISVDIGGTMIPFCNWLGLILMFVFLAAFILLILTFKFKTLYSYAVGLILLASLISFTTPSMFASAIGIEGVTYDATMIIGYIFTFLTIVINLPLLFEDHRFSVNDIVEMAMLIALAVVLDLSFLKFRIQPNGGSISFEMIPLIILSLRFGVYKGFIGCGVVYGLVSCINGGYGLQYYVFDYLLAFGSLAIVGFFRPFIFKKNHDTKFSVIGASFLSLAILIACTLKYLCHVISGVLYWETPWLESFIYSATYVPLSCLLTIIVTILLYKPILLIDKLYPKKTLI